MNGNKSLKIIILVNDTVKLKVSKLYYSNYLAQNEVILISNDFIVPQLHQSRQKSVENVSVVNLI